MTGKEINQRNRNVALEIVELMNVMGNDTDLALALTDQLDTCHRTIQQSFWRVIKRTAGEYANRLDGNTDLRNEQALALAKEIEASDNFCPMI